MAKPNYSFEKRQRELQKKQKKEEKMAQRRAVASKPADASAEQGSGVPAAGPDVSEQSVPSTQV